MIIVGGIAETILNGLGIDPSIQYMGNTVGMYLESLLLFVIGYLAFQFLQWVILRNLHRLALKTTTDIDDILIKMVYSFTPPFYAFLSFWLALRPLELAGIAEKAFNAILIIWIVYQVVMAAGIFIEDIIFQRFVKDKDPNTRSALRLLVNIAKGALWGLGVILMLSNLGVDVSAMLAGVGIGGIAIAFALQGILSDLFSSFSIYFDKPFKVGDYIVLGEHSGTVENIGVKSTRIRSLTGEEIIVSNQELTSTRVRNYQDLQERRVVHHFGILYETPAKQVRAVPEMVQAIIETQEKARFDRVHFFNFGDSSLDFEMVYYALTDDYTEHMTIQQEILTQLFEKFEEEKIGFAYPTRTIYMGK